MKRFNRRPANHRFQTCRMLIGMLLATVVLLGKSDPLYPENKQEPSREKDTIHIVSDILTVDSKENTAEFGGNVRAVLGDLIIAADRVKILFREDFTDENRLPTDETAFKKITATGHVTLKYDNTIAEADRADYHIAEQILVLSGERAKVIMDRSSITGTNIILYRADGRIEVEGKGNTRVEALFFSEEKETTQEADGKPGSSGTR